MTTAVSIIGTTVIINGHTVSGWSSDSDALMMPSDVELAQVERGADGKMIASRTGNLGGTVQFKLLANSPSTQFFAQQASHIQRGGMVEFNGSVRYSSGMVTRMERGVMTKAPLGQTLGSGPAPARVFEFEFEQVLSNYDGARFDSPPAVAV